MYLGKKTPKNNERTIRRFAQSNKWTGSFPMSLKENLGCNQKRKQHLIQRYLFCRTRFFYFSLSHSPPNALIFPFAFIIVFFSFEKQKLERKSDIPASSQDFWQHLLKSCVIFVYVSGSIAAFNVSIWMCKNSQSGFQLPELLVNFACLVTLGD